MDKIVIGGACIACGTCMSMTPLITKDYDGRAVVSKESHLSQYDLNHLNEIIHACPQGNIAINCVVDKAGINDLILLIESLLKNYSVSFPNVLEYKFNKNDYVVDTRYYLSDRNKSGKFLFDSEYAALEEALKTFDILLYSQRKKIIQGIFKEYSEKKLNKYYEKGHKVGSFYYNENIKVQKLLKNILSEIKYVTNNLIDLPDNFSQYYLEPDFFYNEDSLNLSLERIKNCQYIEEVLNKLAPLEWFGNFIDTDYKLGKENKRIYCYEHLTEICEVFSSQLIDECAVILNDYSIKGELLGLLKPFFIDVEKALEKKSDEWVKKLELFSEMI